EFSRALARGDTATTASYRGALQARAKMIDTTDKWFAECDAWIAPTLPLTAFPHQRTGKPLQIDDRREGYSQALASYQCPLATLACPVVAIPIGRDDHGLPIGVQITGRRWSDLNLLRVARQIEALIGGFRPPDLRIDAAGRVDSPA
ncbi:MAG: hypothetical protein B7733_11720, partial [Myxococcales bacterium FL481]